MPPFLTARWRHLLMVNYAIEPSILEPYVPAAVELDSFEGVHYVSVVGFLFERVRLGGFLPVPFHTTFEEVNLRFYVKRRADDGDRRGVVFIKEIVPRAAIAGVARVLYGERYVATSMGHIVDLSGGELEAGSRVAYGWKHDGRWNRVRATVAGSATVPAEDSLESFITEHYWGYARQRDGSAVEYEVRHPRWPVWDAANVRLAADVSHVYGDAFAGPLSVPLSSAFVAVGSDTSVWPGRRLEQER